MTKLDGLIAAREMAQHKIDYIEHAFASGSLNRARNDVQCAADLMREYVEQIDEDIAAERQSGEGREDESDKEKKLLVDFRALMASCEYSSPGNYDSKLNRVNFFWNLTNSGILLGMLNRKFSP